MKEVWCPTCKIKMVKSRSAFNRSWWWGCKNWPFCTMSAAEHPDGGLMSVPADEQTKMLRKFAHQVAGRIWGEWKGMKRGKKKEMYDWLQTNTKSGHFGHMDKTELEETIIKMQKIINATNS